MRKRTNEYFLSSALVTAVMLYVHVSIAAAIVDLAKLHGWQIIVGADASPAEQYAAEELRDHLKRATGRELPIAQRTEDSTKRIFVGDSAAMRASPAGFDTDAFGEEQLRFVVRDDCIAIAGGRPRGTLYGVYTFLEDCVGVRFLTWEHTHVPDVGRSRFIVPQERDYTPPMSFRWSAYGENTAVPYFATRLRVNTITDDPKFGGKTGQSLINHSFYALLSTSEFGNSHPEYFALIDGRRRNLDGSGEDSGGNGTELCLTNYDVLRIVTERVLQSLDKNPAARNVSVSQNDNDYYCRCDKCAAVDSAEASPMGSLLTFVNAVADEVAKKHPNVKVGTLAYRYSRTPPKTVRPRPNVQIQLCSLEACAFHPMTDTTCPGSAFAADMLAWGEICADIFIWNYNTNFSDYLLPCANLRNIEPNIRFFVEHGAKGAFMQGAYDAQGAELSELRNYVIANLLWDPTRGGEQLINEFLDLHYGPAAPPIRRYITALHDRAIASGKHPTFVGGAGDFAVDAEIAKIGINAFQEALKLAGDDQTLRGRIEKASLCVYRAALDPAWHRTRDTSEISTDQEAQLRPTAGRFIALCRKRGVTHSGEGRPIDDELQRLNRMFSLQP